MELPTSRTIIILSDVQHQTLPVTGPTIAGSESSFPSQPCGQHPSKTIFEELEYYLDFPMRCVAPSSLVEMLGLTIHHIQIYIIFTKLKSNSKSLFYISFLSFPSISNEWKDPIELTRPTTCNPNVSKVLCRPIFSEADIVLRATLQSG
ncbi:hypothetical protein Syun_021053 [Stephania yunnanensis]|uniref:Uncharacterized protein n=1 Tax=Stephania yunnanensis TaxID=152371 RepID=A0AAP0IGC9_9MAGN